MPLLKDGKLIDDPWVHVADEIAIPATGAVIVGLKRRPNDGANGGVHGRIRHRQSVP